MTFLRKIILFVLLVTGPAAFAQREKLPDTNVPLNRLDEHGNRTGAWWISHNEHNGEEAFAEFGNYNNGVKYGKWYKIDKEGDISAVQTYKNDRLDGEVKYYAKGILYCTGYYRTVTTGSSNDSIYVVNPETDREVLRALQANDNTQRHGMWRFYDETTGRLQKEEEYQEDILIYKKNYISAQDSIALAKREAQMPHNKRKFKKQQPPPTAVVDTATRKPLN